MLSASAGRLKPRPSLPIMKAGAIAAGLLALALAGCGGGSGDGDTATRAQSPAGGTAQGGEITGKLPPGAVEPAGTTEEEAESPAATEASPEAPAEGPESSGELSGPEGTGAIAAVSEYI